MRTGRLAGKGDWSVSLLAGLAVTASAIASGLPALSVLVLLPVTVAAARFASSGLPPGLSRNMFAGIVFIRIGLLHFQANTRGLPMGGIDWFNYNRIALRLLEDTGGHLINLVAVADADLFSIAIAFLYSVFGANPIQVYFYVFVSSLIAFGFVARAALLMFEDVRVARTACLLYLVWPLEMVFAVTFLREMPIQMLVAACLYGLSRYWRWGEVGQLILALIWAGLASWMHSGLVPMIALCVYVAWRVARRDRDWRGILASTVVLVASIAAGVSSRILLKFSQLDPAAIADGSELVDGSALSANTSYLSEGMTTVSFAQLPYRLLMFATSPLPWQASGSETLLAVIVEGLPNLVLLALVLAAVARSTGAHGGTEFPVRALAGTLLVGYVIFAIGTNNFGTAIRHRTKFFPVAAIVAAYGYWVLVQARVNIRNVRPRVQQGGGCERGGQRGPGDVLDGRVG